MTQTQIACIQVNYGNKLPYPVSVGGFPIPERGILFILIVDRISKSALVLFSLLCAINYHYNKGPVKVESIKCKTIHIGLLLIVILLSKS